MKIALYIEDGLEQIVLTPETDTEKSILAKLTSDSRDMTIKHGSFYDTQGGWKRHQESYFDAFGGERQSDDSTMLILRAKSEPAA